MDPIGKHGAYRDDSSDDGSSSSVHEVDRRDDSSLHGDDFQDEGFDDNEAFVRSHVQRRSHKGMSSFCKIVIIGIFLAILLTLGSESLIHKNGLRNSLNDNIAASSSTNNNNNNSTNMNLLSDREQALLLKEQELADREKAAKEKEEAVAQKHAAAEAREKAVAEREKAAEEAEKAATEHHAAAEAREKAVAEREKAAEEAAAKTSTTTTETTPKGNVDAPPSDGKETKESDKETPTEETATTNETTETIETEEEPTTAEEETTEIVEETTKSEENPTTANDEMPETEEENAEEISENKDETPVVEEESPEHPTTVNEETKEVQENVEEEKSAESKDETPVVEEESPPAKEESPPVEEETAIVEEETKEKEIEKDEPLDDWEINAWNKLTPTKQKQIENYRNENALILNIGVPHHGGTAMCTILGAGAGSAPGFACTEDKFNVMPDPPKCRVGDSAIHTPDDPPFCYSFNEMHREQMPWLSNQTAPFVEAIQPYFKYMNWYFMNPVGREKYDRGRSLESPDWNDPRLVSVIVTRDPLARLLSGDGGLAKKYPGYRQNELGHSQWWDYAVYDDDRNSDNLFLRILGTVHRHERTPEEEAIENHVRRGIPRTTKEVMEMFPTGINENHYNRAKKLLDQFTFVLDIDCLEEGMEAMGKMLRLGQIEPKVIPAHPHDAETPKERIEYDDVYEYLRAKNEWDIKLYEYSKTISLIQCPPKVAPTQKPVEAPSEEANEQVKEITESPTITFTEVHTGGTAPPTAVTAPPTTFNNVI